MFKTLRNMGIGAKILIIVLFICITSQFLIGGMSYNTIKNLGIYSKEIAGDLGARIGDNSESALKAQSEDYLMKLSNSISDLSDSVFKELSDNIDSTVSGIEYIYNKRGNENLYGQVPELPELKRDNLSYSRNKASGKGYIVDRSNSYQDNIFVYDSKDYTNNRNLYKTNAKVWESLSDEERNNLKKDYIIVSDKYVPNDIESEIKLIESFKYYMKSIYDGNETISSIYLGTESGAVYEYSPYPIETRYDPKARPWYKDAVDGYNSGNKRSIWQSKYYSLGTGELCITSSRAYTDSAGNVLGVIAIDMYLDDIERYIVDSKIGDTGYTFVLDNSGQVIMSSDTQDESVFPDYPLESEIDDTYRNVLTDMTLGKEGVAQSLISGKEYYVAYSPMKTTGWSMGIMTETNEIISPIMKTHDFIENKILESKQVINGEIGNVIFKFVVILILCSGIVVLIGIWLSNEIVKPLKRLKNGARKIGNGNLSVRFTVRSSDEVGELAGTFNKMTGSLQSYIDNLALTTKEKEKIHSELSVAKKIQLSMLPCIFPAFPERKDFDIYAIMDPAKEVGGDFYDFFFIDKNHIALVVADVSGKGVSAALFMVIAKILIKNQAQSGDLPGKIFETVNNQLCENNDAGMFVTAFMGILNMKTGQFTYSNAGHNPPIIYKAAEDKIEWIKKEHGFVLAGMKDMKYKEGTMHLEANDVLYMYTDGVTEAMNGDNELYSEKRLEEILNYPNIKKMCVKDIIKYLRKSIDDFADGAERADDITILGFKILALDDENE